MPQAHCFKVMELALKAEAMADGGAPSMTRQTGSR
jgi:hypothetical protein